MRPEYKQSIAKQMSSYDFLHLSGVRLKIHFTDEYFFEQQRITDILKHLPNILQVLSNFF